MYELRSYEVLNVFELVWISVWRLSANGHCKTPPLRPFECSDTGIEVVVLILREDQKSTIFLVVLLLHAKTEAGDKELRRK